MGMTEGEATDLFRAAPERFVELGDVAAAVRTVGRGPDVLFVHGWPVSGATFRQLLPHLVDHVTCHVLDLPGAGQSRFDAGSEVSVARHVESVRRALDEMVEDRCAVVGHDSGGLIARHAAAGHPKVRAFGLIDTEQPQGLNLRFKAFLAGRHLPGYGRALGWIAGQPRLRRNGLVLGKAFADRSLLDGEFDELFLQPLHRSPAHLDAAIRILQSFDVDLVAQLADVHRRIDVPVQLVWGEQDAFFPVAWAREMVGTFPDARLEVVPGAGLFAHEERPAEVAAALLPLLAG
ncbi:MAG: alpha/beta hydrolase [Acidimicrobiales bacterium]